MSSQIVTECSHPISNTVVTECSHPISNSHWMQPSHLKQIRRFRTDTLTQDRYTTQTEDRYTTQEDRYASSRQIRQLSTDTQIHDRYANPGQICNSGGQIRNSGGQIRNSGGQIRKLRTDTQTQTEELMTNWFVPVFRLKLENQRSDKKDMLQYNANTTVRWKFIQTFCRKQQTDFSGLIDSSLSMRHATPG